MRIALLTAMLLSGCSQALTMTPITYQWLCHQADTKPCTLLGYEFNTSDATVARRHGSEMICDNGVKSVTVNAKRGNTLLVCN